MVLSKILGRDEETIYGLYGDSIDRTDVFICGF